MLKLDARGENIWKVGSSYMGCKFFQQLQSEGMQHVNHIFVEQVNLSLNQRKLIHFILDKASKKKEKKKPLFDVLMGFILQQLLHSWRNGKWCFSVSCRRNKRHHIGSLH